ncbi:unnamed protein product [Paramecium octaurelia]|uniref:PPM-type phosphatase domain-containing protein n=1 Tax=Paramecium octaurelia TaxID=43137 RepID=A0A8S1VMM6_PAROT|nr:unnamed protein product [Paramecium octaurelia]
MFNKFGQQLKPIGIRSSSETKKEQANQKQNFQIVPKRQKSESRVSEEQKSHFQSVPTQRGNVRLPDLNKSQKQIEKSISGGDITKKPPLMRSRIIIDSKQKQQQQQQQSLTQSITIKSKKEESIQHSQQQREKMKVFYFSQSRPGYDGISEKTNQDRELCLQFDENNYAFVVMDGHGMDGERASGFVKEQLKINLNKFYKVFDFQKIFLDIHQKMKLQTVFGCQFSGTTATVILLNENNIQCGWVGDSRAILVRKHQDLTVIELSVDHKPHLEGERQRIEQHGGVVDTYHLPSGAPIGPSRVWAKGAQFPGLAMSRSLGDLVAASVGVSQMPELNLVDIVNKEDLFIVLGSDGIWEFLNNQTIAELVYPFYMKNDPQGACQKIIQEAVAAWKAYSEGIDDITAIVIFFQYGL